MNQQPQSPNFPSNLPPRPDSSSNTRPPNPYNPANHLPAPTSHSPTSEKHRYCWAFSLSSYDPRTSDKALLARRTCMILTLAIRTAISIIMTIRAAIDRRWVNLGLWIAFGIIGFLVIAWCLAVIGECRGTRTVWKMRLTRSFWDVILLLSVAVAVANLVIAFFVSNSVTTMIWPIAWFFLAVLAWIATSNPDQESHV